MISRRGAGLAEMKERRQVSSGEVVPMDECNSVGAGSTLFGAGLLTPPKRPTEGLLITFTHFGPYGPMLGMQHDNINIDGYRDQESKNDEETCGRPFRRGQETRAERGDPRPNSSSNPY